MADGWQREMPVDDSRFKDLCDCMSMYRSTGSVHLKSGHLATSKHRNSSWPQPIVHGRGHGLSPKRRFFDDLFIRPLPHRRQHLDLVLISPSASHADPIFQHVLSLDVI